MEKNYCYYNSNNVTKLTFCRVCIKRDVITDCLSVKEAVFVFSCAVTMLQSTVFKYPAW